MFFFLTSEIFPFKFISLIQFQQSNKLADILGTGKKAKFVLNKPKMRRKGVELDPWIKGREEEADDGGYLFEVDPEGAYKRLDMLK